jgi:hypothetical protein
MEGHRLLFHNLRVWGCGPKCLLRDLCIWLQFLRLECKGSNHLLQIWNSELFQFLKMELFGRMRLSLRSLQLCALKEKLKWTQFQKKLGHLCAKLELSLYRKPKEVWDWPFCQIFWKTKDPYSKAELMKHKPKLHLELRPCQAISKAQFCLQNALLTAMNRCHQVKWSMELLFWQSWRDVWRVVAKNTCSFEDTQELPNSTQHLPIQQAHGASLSSRFLQVHAPKQVWTYCSIVIQALIYLHQSQPNLREWSVAAFTWGILFGWKRSASFGYSWS